MDPIISIIINSLVTIGIAYYQIQEGRKLNAENLKTNEENAGKNRVIYSIKQEGLNDNEINNLNEVLKNGNYTILTAFVDPYDAKQTR
jgi:hypothetical protein